MKGLLAHRSPLNQILTLVGVTLACGYVVTLVGTVVVQAITGVQLEALASVSTKTIQQPGLLAFMRGMQLVQFIGLFVLPTWFCAYLFSQQPNRLIGFQLPNLPVYWIFAILIMLISFPFIQLIGELNQQIQFPSEMQEWFEAKEKSAANLVNALLSMHTPTDLVLNILFIALLAGVGEELLFRGMIQRLLSLQFGRWVGILVAAAIFSAIHLQFFGFFPRFLLGIVLGVLFAYSGSLWVSILAHFFYDAALITAAYFNPSMLKSEQTIQLSDLILPAILSLVLSLLLIRIMIRLGKKYPPAAPTYVKARKRNTFLS